MLTNPTEEWQRLTAHYRELGDEELLELAGDFGNLTEVAQRALREELKARGLETQRGADAEPAATDTAQARRPAEVHWESRNRWAGPGGQQNAATAAEEGEAPPVEYTWKVSLAEFDTMIEALQLAQALSRAGIECWVDRPIPRVLVAADQLDQAQIVLEKPIPQDILDESQMETPEFEIPTCPACGAADPTLEDVEPVNRWHCESCGREWTQAS